MSLPTFALAGLVLACTSLAVSEGPPPPKPRAHVAFGETHALAAAMLRPSLHEMQPPAGDGPAVADIVPVAFAPDPSVMTVETAPGLAAPEQSEAAGAEPQEAEASRALSTDELCEVLASAAQAHDLPVAFFIRLIWQESRFDPSATSRAGAQGVAQFMPKVAAALGLADPRDPVQALPASARFLGELRRQFGNLGLAAAAYNAGSGRIREWLARRGKLPKETRSYVASVTGLAPERWVSAQPANVAFAVPERAPCRDLAVAAAEAETEAGTQAVNEMVPLPPERPRAAARAALLRPHAVARAPEPEPKPRHADAKSEKPWGVQVTANWSETKARETFERLRRKHPRILARKEPIVVRGKLAGRGAAHRIRIAMDTRAGAEELCLSLKSAGGACVVLRN
jgi:hypothetical protein